MLRESWEEAFGRANTLLFEGRFDDACEVLRSARDDAEAHGYPFEAAFYSNVLGSFLSSRGDTEGALAAFRAAEFLDPSGARWKLSTADFLLFGCDQASEALAKTREVLRLSLDPPLLHAATSTLGLAHLRLGDEKAAIEALDAMSRPGVLDVLPPSACDLRLVEALLSRHLYSERCHDYLRGLLQKSIAAEDNRAQSAIERLLANDNGPKP